MYKLCATVLGFFFSVNLLVSPEMHPITTDSYSIHPLETNQKTYLLSQFLPTVAYNKLIFQNDYSTTHLTSNLSVTNVATFKGKD